MPKSLEQRFWEKVEIKGLLDCWEWKGSKTNGGYGTLSRDKKWWLAHRLVWTMTYGDIPKGLLVLHKCDKPPCVNPNHLFLGTQRDNMHDMAAKGRMVQGVDRSLAKLDPGIVAKCVEEIRSGVTYKVLSERYGASRSAINNAVLGKTWKRESRETFRRRRKRNASQS